MTSPLTYTIRLLPRDRWIQVTIQDPTGFTANDLKEIACERFGILPVIQGGLGESVRSFSPPQSPNFRALTFDSNPHVKTTQPLGFSFSRTEQISQITPDDQRLISSSHSRGQSQLPHNIAIRKSPGKESSASVGGIPTSTNMLKCLGRASSETLSLQSVGETEEDGLGTEFEDDEGSAFEGSLHAGTFDKDYSIASSISGTSPQKGIELHKNLMSPSTDGRHVAFKEQGSGFLGMATGAVNGGNEKRDGRPARRTSILGTTASLLSNSSGVSLPGSERKLEKEKKKVKKEKDKGKQKKGKSAANLGHMSTETRKEILNSLKLTNGCKGHTLNEALTLSLTTVADDLLILHFRNVYHRIPMRTFYEPVARMCVWYLKPGVLTPKMIARHANTANANFSMNVKEPKGAWKRVWISVEGPLLSVMKDQRGNQVLSNHTLPAKSFREAFVSAIFEPSSQSLAVSSGVNLEKGARGMAESELEFASRFLVMLVFSDGSLLVLRAEHEEDHKDLMRLLGPSLANPYLEKGDDMTWRVRAINAAIRSNYTHVRKKISFQSSALISPSRRTFNLHPPPLGKSKPSGDSFPLAEGDIESYSPLTPFSPDSRTPLEGSVGHGDLTSISGVADDEDSATDLEDDVDEEEYGEGDDSFVILQSPSLSSSRLTSPDSPSGIGIAISPSPLLTPAPTPTMSNGYFSLARSRSATLSSINQGYANHKSRSSSGLPSSVSVSTIVEATTKVIGRSSPKDRQSSLPLQDRFNAATVRSRSVRGRPELLSVLGSNLGSEGKGKGREVDFGPPLVGLKVRETRSTTAPQKRHSTTDAVLESEKPRTPLVPSQTVTDQEGELMVFGSVGRRKGMEGLGLIPKH